jgi:ribonuclease Z
MKNFGVVIAVLVSVLSPRLARAQDPAPEPDIRVILLGTGGPELTPHRLGYSTLVEAGGHKLLFDAGRGVLQRLYESSVNVTEVRSVFFTHLHNDHVEGLPPLWMTPWFLLGRDKPMEVWGPIGTARLISGMEAMFAFDIEHRVNQFNKRENLMFTVREIADGEVYNRDGVKVFAFSVWHDDGNPAFGYRVTYKGRSVVLSGDTTYSDNVVAAGRGADLIVHNVIAVSDALAATPELGPVLAKLTTPEQAASVFSQASPRMAVFSHIVKKELPGRSGDQFILQRVRAAGYAGPLEMGYDRMTIEIGRRVRVFQPTTTDHLPDVDRKAAYAPAGGG